MIYLPVSFRGFVMHHIIASYGSDLTMKDEGKITFTETLSRYCRAQTIYIMFRCTLQDGIACWANLGQCRDDNTNIGPALGQPRLLSGIHCVFTFQPTVRFVHAIYGTYQTRSSHPRSQCVPFVATVPLLDGHVITMVFVGMAIASACATTSRFAALTVDYVKLVLRNIG